MRDLIDIENGLKAIVAVAAALWGGLEPLGQVLIIFMALDIVTGLLAGFITKSLSSDVSFRGMAKKALVLLLVAGAKALESQTGVKALGEAVAGFYLMHEGLSILENAANAGLPVPAILKDALAKLSPEQEV